MRRIFPYPHSWGVSVKRAGGKLTTDKRGNPAFRCGPSDFRTQNVPAFREGLAPDMRELVSLSFLAGRWLNPKSEELPHAFEISFVGVE